MNNFSAIAWQEQGNMFMMPCFVPIHWFWIL